MEQVYIFLLTYSYRPQGSTETHVKSKRLEKSYKDYCQLILLCKQSLNKMTCHQ